ncbi:MAG: carboxynorspermidine decarboxylase [Gammaproteobacteria bacterium]
MRELCELPTPCYLFDEAAIKKNLARVRRLREESGCRVLLALKGFAAWKLFPLFRDSLRGVSASSLYEARLGAEEFGGEVHIYAPAYRAEEFAALRRYASHFIFNSRAQWRRFGENLDLPCGVRVNPGYSEVRNPLYDPCRPRSQFGVAAADAAFIGGDNNIEGLHFHALCEQNADALARVAEKVHSRFGAVLPRMRWINFGGGHLLAAEEYDRAALAAIVRDFRARYDAEIYLEPGGGLVHECCELVASVLDVLPGGAAILDCSASAHLPDVLETPYRPRIAGAAAAGELAHTYRLCGPTCMAGDSFGEYSFARPLRPGARVQICDAAAYSVVKHTTFNGVAPPSIALRRTDGGIEILRHPDYDDYRRRMS